MKRFGSILIFIIIAIIILPIIIIGGIGPGIKIVNNTKIINEVVNKEVKDKNEKNIEYINVFVKNKIIKMKLEDYIVGVVAAEMPVRFGTEAIKAQAITARTFAVSKILSLGGTGCVKHSGSDVCSDIHCQAYISKSDRFKSWKSSEAQGNWNKISSAVLSTKGMIISYNDKIADGVKYFSTSNGKTENSINVFGYKEPYLVSVTSSNENESPSYESVVTISVDNFIKTIKGMNKKTIGLFKASNFKIGKVVRTGSGRINKIKIGEYEYSGQQMRQAFNLKSTDFRIKISKNVVSFKVKGFGHGVGLSQWGANEMSKRGSSYTKIIQHYFTGTKVKNINEVIIH